MSVFKILTFFMSFILLNSEIARSVEKEKFPADRSVDIIGNGLSEQEKKSLQQLVEFARHKYELSFSQVPGKIKIFVNESKALRAGYSLSDDSIHFPNIKNVLNSGINSNDVIIHESFHLFTCRTFPHTCPQEIGKNEEMIQLQESLADFFTHTLSPDNCFGENFYKDQPCIRNYENSLLISLSDSPHLKGSALTKYLIKNSISFNDISLFLKNSEFTGFNLDSLKSLSQGLKADIDQDLSYVLQDSVLDYKYSVSRKYWINEGQSLELIFNPNKELLTQYPDLKISWSSKEGVTPLFFQITGDDFKFKISPLQNAKPEKIIATLKNGTQILGYRAYYFGMRYSKK